MSQDCNVLIVEADQKTVEIAAPLLKNEQCKVSYVKQGVKCSNPSPEKMTFTWY